jgi:hypothetical protein
VGEAVGLSLSGKEIFGGECNERQSRILFVPNSEDLEGVWRKLNNDGRHNFYLPDNTRIMVMKRQMFGGQSTGHL